MMFQSGSGMRDTYRTKDNILNSLFRLTAHNNDIFIFYFGSIKKIALVTFEFDVHQDDESAVFLVTTITSNIMLCNY